jgi:hypothetical protein
MIRKVLPIEKLGSFPWLAEGLALLGGLAYFIQTWGYAHSRDSILDEGLYLLKGVLFVSGKYEPFQPFGVWTNHMPFSFLIPGVFQELLGPGLRTGRYYAVFIALLFLLGAGIFARRLVGRWGAAWLVWTIAMNPAMIKAYSIAISQGLVACLLVWVLVLAIGRQRPFWQVLLGSALAGVLVMTRLNMVPVLFFVLIYVFWQRGSRMGVWAAIVGLGVFLGVQALYYPEIMALWVRWFPPKLQSLFSSWGYQGVQKLPIPDIPLSARFSSLFTGFRRHYVALVGLVSTWILWPVNWLNENRRMVILFSALYCLLLGMHAWTTLGGTYCVFCFSWYLFFFDILALLVIVISWSSWRWTLNAWRKSFAWFVILVVVLSLVFGLVFHVGGVTAPGLDKVVRYFMTLPVPRLEGRQVQAGEVALWVLIANRFALLEQYSYDQSYLYLEQGFRLLVSLVISGAILMILWGGTRWIRSRFSAEGWRVDSGAMALVTLFLVGWALTPFAVVGRIRDPFDCDLDVIQSYESAGIQLAIQVPPGSKVYWLGGDTQVLLLYLKSADFYPAMFNANFSLRQGDPDQLARYGFWNDELARQWAREADVILIETRMTGGWLSEYVSTAGFRELPHTPEVGCRGGTSLHVYQRQP